jgi:hypothetical protein
MRWVSTMTRDEVVAAAGVRYRGAGRAERGRILDELVSVTGHHRKHLMRLRRCSEQARTDGARPARGSTMPRCARRWWWPGRRLTGSAVSDCGPQERPGLRRAEGRGGRAAGSWLPTAGGVAGRGGAG